MLKNYVQPVKDGGGMGPGGGGGKHHAHHHLLSFHISDRAAADKQVLGL